MQLLVMKQRLTQIVVSSVLQCSLSPTTTALKQLSKCKGFAHLRDDLVLNPLLLLEDVTLHRVPSAGSLASLRTFGSPFFSHVTLLMALRTYP